MGQTPKTTTNIQVFRKTMAINKISQIVWGHVRLIMHIRHWDRWWCRRSSWYTMHFRFERTNYDSSVHRQKLWLWTNIINSTTNGMSTMQTKERIIFWHEFRENTFILLEHILTVPNEMMKNAWKMSIYRN